MTPGSPQPIHSPRAAAAATASVTYKLAIYGPSVELSCDVPELIPGILHLLSPFGVAQFPQSLGITRGSVRPYSEREVVRRLPPSAQPLHRPGDLTEIYAHDDRFWTIDDRWGMCEINILRGQWQSWVLPQAKLDTMRLFEATILWPLAQLLRNQGVHLLPAASAVRDGFAVLFLSPFGLEPELTALLAAGYRLIGQRWTAVRQEDDRTALLHLPGLVQCPAPSALMSTDASGWIDLTLGRTDLAQRHAFCSAAAVIEAGRRPRAHLRQLSGADTANVLRRAWPLPELHPHRRSSGHLAQRLAQRARCFQMQLSRTPRDMLMLLESLRSTSPARAALSGGLIAGECSPLRAGARRPDLSRRISADFAVEPRAGARAG